MAGHAEPLTHATYQLARGRELDVLTGAEARAIYPDMRDNLPVGAMRRRYAIVGAGARAVEMYARPLLGDYAERAELAGIYDPNPLRAQAALALAGGEAPMVNLGPFIPGAGGSISTSSIARGSVPSSVSARTAVKASRKRPTDGSRPLAGRSARAAQRSFQTLRRSPSAHSSRFATSS